MDQGLAEQLLREHGWLRQEQDQVRLRELLQACLLPGLTASKDESWVVLTQLALDGEAGVERLFRTHDVEEGQRFTFAELVGLALKLKRR